MWCQIRRSLYRHAVELLYWRPAVQHRLRFSSFEPVPTPPHHPHQFHRCAVLYPIALYEMLLGTRLLYSTVHSPAQARSSAYAATFSPTRAHQLTTDYEVPIVLPSIQTQSIKQTSSIPIRALPWPQIPPDPGMDRPAAPMYMSSNGRNRGH